MGSKALVETVVVAVAVVVVAAGAVAASEPRNPISVVEPLATPFACSRQVLRDNASWLQCRSWLLLLFFMNALCGFVFCLLLLVITKVVG